MEVIVNKWIKFALIVFLIAACKGLPSLENKGKYTDDSADIFKVSGAPDQTLPLITDTRENLYVWKTMFIPTVVDTIDSEIVTAKVFRTMTFGELNEYQPQRNEIYSNYLFFIDSYRFIFLSQDDFQQIPKKTRQTLHTGILQAHYETGLGHSYTPRRTGPFSNSNWEFREMTRGYYIRSGNDLTLQFDGEKPYTVKAFIEEGTIVFKSITCIFNCASLDPGCHTLAFDEIYPSYAQPIFERPQSPRDTVFYPHFSLFMDFYSDKLKIKEKDKIDIHKQLDRFIETQEISNENIFNIQVDSIRYDYQNTQPVARTYFLTIIYGSEDLNTNSLGLSRIITRVKENLNKPSVDTW